MARERKLEKKDFSFGLVKVKLPVGYPGGEPLQTVGDMDLKLKEEIGVGDKYLVIISIQVVAETICVMKSHSESMWSEKSRGLMSWIRALITTKRLIYIG